MSKQYVPICLFLYRRPDLAVRVLKSLAKCPEFASSPLRIFVDGPKGSQDAEGVGQVRNIVESLSHPDLRRFISVNNKGLSRSIIEGVNTVINDYGRAIIVEDDLIVSPVFLSYMNASLTKYESVDHVWSVNAYCYRPVTTNPPQNAYFLRFCHPWGWGTWSRAWKRFDPGIVQSLKFPDAWDIKESFNLDGAEDFFGMLRKQELGQIDSWWVRWYAAMFLNNGIGLFPPEPMVVNAGLDARATHWSVTSWLLRSKKENLAQDMPSLSDSLVEDAFARRSFRSGMRPAVRRVIRIGSRLRDMMFRRSTKHVERAVR